MTNPWVIGFGSSLAAAIAIAILGWLKGWWFQQKSTSAIDLATRVLQYLEGDGREKSTKLISDTKYLGDSLIASYSYREKTSHDADLEINSLKLAGELLASVKPLLVELSASDKALDELKRTVSAVSKSLETRQRVIKHLCNPPNPPAMDAGHVRDQLLADNVGLHDLVHAAKGEAAIFLRGFGLGWFARCIYLRKIKKEERALYKQAVSKKYRTVMRQTSYFKSIQ